MPRTLHLATCLALALAPLANAQTPAQTPAQTHVQPPAERHTTAAFDSARAAGPLALRAFLERMPKGADLHHHLSGAVYAEHFIDQAIADHLCVDLATSVLTPTCAAGKSVPVANALADQVLYDQLVDAWSMRSFVPTSGVSGHDHFFATFPHWDALPGSHDREWFAEATARAARQNVQYLEIMHLPVVGDAFALAATLKLDLADPANFAAARQQLLGAGMDKAITDARADTDAMVAYRNRQQGCGTPAATAACALQARFIFGVLRDFSPAQIFAQTLIGFELATRDPRYVAVNFLRAEDWHGSLAEYHLGMQMLDYLHTVYPQVHISLHAGELAPGLVPPSDLTFHIREAVDLGHAERIGHGVDVMQETDPQLLLKELADRHIMVEINLTSNDVILGIDPAHHPLPFYRAAHVPVALSTDDEGVSRIDLTHEYVRAALDFHLTYLDLKQMVRTSLEHTFLPGPSLWSHPDAFTHVVTPCATGPLGAETPTPACTEFLRASPHAAQQWELEHRFRLFESPHPLTCTNQPPPAPKTPSFRRSHNLRFRLRPAPQTTR